MSLGHAGRLYLLAFDHRGSFCRDLFGIYAEPDADQTEAIADAKRLIFEGLLGTVESGAVGAAEAAVLVDERFGAEVAGLARERQLALAMPVERSERRVFELEYGDAFDQHIERFDPDFAKVLVRYNPDADAAENRIQLERLRRLADWLHARDRKLLFELLVPPTPEQLAAAGGEMTRYQAELRPELISRGIADAQSFGVEVDVWKLEGVDRPEDAEMLADQARSGAGREHVACTVLGAGAGDERVERWLRAAAPVDGFCGFAIGRSIWKRPLEGYLAEELRREEAARLIARHYAHFADVYMTAAHA